MKYKNWWTYGINIDFAANVDGFRADHKTVEDKEDYIFVFYNMSWRIKLTSSKVGEDI